MQLFGQHHIFEVGTKRCENSEWAAEAAHFVKSRLRVASCATDHLAQVANHKAPQGGPLEHWEHCFAKETAFRRKQTKHATQYIPEMLTKFLQGSHRTFLASNTPHKPGCCRMHSSLTVVPALHLLRATCPICIRGISMGNTMLVALWMAAETSSGPKRHSR